MVTPVWNRPGNSTTGNRPHCKSQASAGFPIAPRLRFRLNLHQKSSRPTLAREIGCVWQNRQPGFAWSPKRFSAPIPQAISPGSAEGQTLVDEPMDLRGGPVGTVTLDVDRPGRIVVQSNCPTQQLLVVNESYYPGWTTTIDGHDAKLLRANGDFLGVVTPPGRHEIQLEFQPESLRIGRLLSCFGLSLLVVTFLLSGTFFRSARV